MNLLAIELYLACIDVLSATMDDLRPVGKLKECLIVDGKCENLCIEVESDRELPGELIT